MLSSKAERDRNTESGWYWKVLPLSVGDNSVFFFDALANINFADYGNDSSLINTKVTGTTISTSTLLSDRAAGVGLFPRSGERHPDSSFYQQVLIWPSGILISGF